MPNDKLKYLGQRMREARQTAHLTQEELSLKSHVSVRQIAKIEKGTMNPSYEILYALIHTLEYLRIFSFIKQHRMMKK